MSHAPHRLAIALIAASFASLGCAIDDRALATAVTGPEAAVSGLEGPGALGLGVSCDEDRQCRSGACIDAVCCESACGEPCAACNVPGRLGRCTALEAGPECVVAASCEDDGSCALPLGAACASSADCASAFCVDGLCCDSACAATCEQCSESGECARSAECACQPGESSRCGAVHGSLGECAALPIACSADGTWPSSATCSGALELCDSGGRDENCDGLVNEGCECNEGDTIDCALLQGAVGACSRVLAGCTDGRWLRQACEPTSAEVCDALFDDEDCDGQSNESPCEAFDSIVGGGDGHMCGISTGGRVLCWGSNEAGQLGDGTTTERAVPTEVLGLGTDTQSLAIGPTTTCAVSSTGSVSCWGGGLQMVRGAGSEPSSLAPLPATLFPQVLAMGFLFRQACALLPDRTVQCTDLDPLTGEVRGGVITLPGYEGVQAITTNTTGLCGILADGSVRCSGGDGILFYTPTGLTGAVQISGEYQEGCAIVANGAVQCFGSQGYTALGEAADPGPRAVVTVPGVSGAVALDARLSHGCALIGDGTVRCWGWVLENVLQSVQALQGVDRLGSSQIGDRRFFRVASGEVLGFTFANRGRVALGGNPGAADDGPYRVLGP